MQRTRQEILNILKRNGRATLDQLAKGVGLVPVTVRAHLSVLERDRLVTYEEVRGKIGRPYYVYSLTEEAENLFPKNYHVVTNRVLDSLTALAGRDGVEQLSNHMARSWADERKARLEGKTFDEKVSEVARIRSEEGAWAESERVGDDYYITQFNCVCPKSSSRHPEVICATELAYMRQLLGPDVERVEWTREGARACKYRVPVGQAESADAAEPEGSAKATE